jgi:NADH:ubiquinone oxidoreductase subunit E
MQLVTKYKQFVISNASWLEALEQALGNKSYLPEATVELLAKAHAEAYGEKHKVTIFYQQSTTGSWQFYDAEECERESRHDTATKQWQRTVGKYHKTNAKKKVSKQVDKVAKKIEALRKEFSKTELKRIANGIV